MKVIKRLCDENARTCTVAVTATASAATVSSSEKPAVGPLEGMNNKIGLLQRKAYGFSDREFFKLKIMALHEATAVLIG